ncbi:hypothetical protein [Rhodococcus aerolatus]
MTLPDRFCPACFRSVAVTVPAVAPGRGRTGLAVAEPWVYREHQRTRWDTDDPTSERCAGSGRTEHQAREAW